MFLQKTFGRLFKNAFDLNENNILSLLEENKEAKLLDLGCDDGTWTQKLAKKVGTTKIYGFDIVEERAVMAKDKGIVVTIGDANKPLPFEDNKFDVIHSNQVIEHIGDLDMFMSEQFRILKPGGYIVLSTENGSSWHNIFAAIMGWQIFSLTNVSSKKLGIGNPIAFYRDRTDVYKASTWTHKTIFNYLGLKELFELYTFDVEKVLGAGYHPLPANFGKYDVRHAHFLALKARKSTNSNQ